MDTGKAELKERFVELRAAGLSYADAAEQLGVSKPTLIAWSKELSFQIKNARNLRLDALFERFAIAKEKRVEVFGERLKAILTELDKRDLTEVPTPALLTLALKYGEHLREEYRPLELTTPGSFERTDDLFPATWEG
jgi:DNA-binding XRE family transcriptional regulator